MYAGRKGSLEMGPGRSGASPHLCSPRLLLVSKTTHSPADAPWPSEANPVSSRQHLKPPHPYKFCARRTQYTRSPAAD